MIDKPLDLYMRTRSHGTIKIEYILFAQTPGGLGVVCFGIVEGDLVQLHGKLQKGQEDNGKER